MQSSTGLSGRKAALLAYSGWWLTGFILWFLERRDRAVRFHAAQSLAAFGLIAALFVLLMTIAVASLSVVPWTFTPLVNVAAVVWLTGVLLWAVVMWKTAHGEELRLPVAATLADRLCAHGSHGRA